MKSAFWVGWIALINMDIMILLTVNFAFHDFEGQIHVTLSLKPSHGNQVVNQFLDDSNEKMIVSN